MRISAVSNRFALRGEKTAMAFLLIFLSVGPGAKAEVITSRYALGVAGMSVGDAIVRTTLSANRYKVAVSADAGVLFFNVKVQGEAAGSRSGAKLKPEHFRMVTSGMEDSAIEIRFTGASATSANISPPLPPSELNNRVPFTEEHFKGVLDPLSALLLTSLKPSPTTANPCSDVLPVFTGFTRFDVSLRPQPANTRSAAAIATCQVHYHAIAGHPRSASNGLRNLKLEIDFQRLTKPHLWVLQHLAIPTTIGTVTVDRAETAVSGS
jgi:hypothetical protein